MKQIRAACLAALFLCTGLFAPAQAQDITLKSRDGGVELTGTLLGFDGEFYRLRSKYGVLTIDSSGVLCEGVGCPSLTDYVADLTIAGSPVLGRLLIPALIESFAAQNGYGARRDAPPDGPLRYALTSRASGKLVARITLLLTDTDRGLAALREETAQIALASREIRPEELRAAREAGQGDPRQIGRSLVLTLDALLPVVAPANPVTAISPADLSRVLAGEIGNWRDLGGPDAPITLHLPPPGTGLSQAIHDKLLRPARKILSETAQIHATQSALTEAVATDPFGLGLAEFSDPGNAKALDLTGPCGFSLRATRRNIKTEDYPLTLPLLLYLPQYRLPALARDFLSFARSPAAQPVIRRSGFVDQSFEDMPLDQQGNRLANAVQVTDGAEGLAELQRMVRVLSPMRRLTLSFRFEPGAPRMDAQSRSNVELLARALEQGRFDGRRLVFVGFSDGQGPAAPNLSIARKRAASVRQAVLTAAETADLSQFQIESDAFGEAMPMACDDSRWGRQTNRRVEVWVQ